MGTVPADVIEVWAPRLDIGQRPSWMLTPLSYDTFMAMRLLGLLRCTPDGDNPDFRRFGLTEWWVPRSRFDEAKHFLEGL